MNSYDNPDNFFEDLKNEINGFLTGVNAPEDVQKEVKVYFDRMFEAVDELSEKGLPDQEIADVVYCNLMSEINASIEALPVKVLVLADMELLVSLHGRVVEAIKLKQVCSRTVKRAMDDLLTLN